MSDRSWKDLRRELKHAVTSTRNISCLTTCILTNQPRVNGLGRTHLGIHCRDPTDISARKCFPCCGTYRATPTIRLDDSRRARGSLGWAIRSHNCEISAVKTDRLGSFLNDDLEPKVAASLLKLFRWLSARRRRPTREGRSHCPSETIIRE